MSRALDLAGKVFGKLTVLSRNGSTKSGIALWTCRCECGTESIVYSSKLKNGYTKSCGCLKGMQGETHGESGSNLTAEYRTWASIKRRCYNAEREEYLRYGAIGISVCERWLDNYDNFLSDMGRRPSDDHSIERVNNGEGYSPSNCIWATRHIQNRNKRSNIWWTFDGRTQVVADWAKELGIPHTTLFMRVNKYNWSVEKALSTPAIQHKR